VTRVEQWRAALQLTRPGQWPVLTAQLVVSMLLVAPAATGGGCWLNFGSLTTLAAAWLAWVVMLNGATLAFNSAYDRDTGPVAYLPTPPDPPSWLAGAAVAVMLLGSVLGWLLVGSAFGLVVLGCVILSILYSHPATRWKARPGLDLLVNMVGYGAGTTAAGILAGRAAYLAGNCGLEGCNAVTAGTNWFIAGFGLLFGSFYPMTQLYQMEEDRERGDRTLATALGVRDSLILAQVLGLLAAVAFALGLGTHGRFCWWPLPAAALAAWQGHLLYWLFRHEGMESPELERGMYRGLALWLAIDITLVVSWMCP